MACFLVPTAEAIVTTVITKAAAKEEKKDFTDVSAESTVEASEKPAKMPFVRKLRWLSNVAWGSRSVPAIFDRGVRSGRYGSDAP